MIEYKEHNLICTTMEELADTRGEAGFIPHEHLLSPPAHPKFIGILSDKYVYWAPSLKRLDTFTEEEREFILRGEGIPT